MTRLILILSGVGLLISAGFCQDPDIPIENLTDYRTTLTWRPSDAESIIVEADDGYQIQVNVTQLDIHGENEDYVIVKAINDDADDDDDEANGLMFTYTVSGKPCYLYNSNKVQAKYVGTNESNNFLIQFIRVGEAATTTTEPPSTTTTEAMPTPSPEESNTLTVYLYGRASSEFDNSEIVTLRTAIAGMGAAYCHDQGCPLNGSITLNNAKIAVLEQCPMAWENYDTCVNLTFALPIIKRDDFDESKPWTGYQLNKSHLKKMWDTYAGDYMKKIGLDLYNVPNIGKMMTYRLIVTCLVIVGLVIVILVLRHFIARITKRRRKLSDTVSIIGNQSNRTSQLSLTPHYLQEVPSLFTNDYPLYADQVPHKPFTDFKTNYNDDIEPSTSNKLNISNDDSSELVDTNA